MAGAIVAQGGWLDQGGPNAGTFRGGCFVSEACGGRLGAVWHSTSADGSAQPL